MSDMDTEPSTRTEGHEHGQTPGSAHEHIHEHAGSWHGGHDHEHDHLHGEEDVVAFGFRCTLCLRSIGKPLTREDLGIPAGEELQAGKMYRYDRCYCGFGRFVIAERTYINPEVLHRHMSEHMQH